jgi:hypothetical protein
VRAQIDNDVKDGAARAANNLGLGMRLILVMKSPQRPSPGVVRNRALYEVNFQSALSERLGAECTREKASFVSDRFDADPKCSFDCERLEKHCITTH